MKTYFSILIVTCYVLFTIASAADINNIPDSQWRGPDRDGVYPEAGLLTKWSPEGPPLKWTISGLGEGYSSPAVTENSVYITGMLDGIGYVFAYDLQGQLRWKSDYGAEWKKSYRGTRTTPTVFDDVLYIEGTQGDIVCMLTRDGSIKWRRNVFSEYEGRSLRWGLTESLLVQDDIIYCTPGGKEHNILALNRHTGELVWSSPGNKERASYCSPRIIDHNDRRILVTMTAESILGLNLEDGSTLWRHEHKTSYDVNPNTPYYMDGQLYAVSGYGTGGVLLEISPDGKKISEIWRDSVLDIQMDGFVVVDGFIYGTSHKKPAWHCLSWKDGRIKYTNHGIGKGNVILADGLIYHYSDNGTVGLIEPNSKKFNLLSSFKISAGTGEHWAHPVIRNGVFYIRHGDTLLAFNIQN